MKDLNMGLESWDDIVIDEAPCSEEELTEDEEKILDELGIHGESRRKFLGQVGASAFGMLALQVIANQETFAAGGALNEAAAPVSLENVVKVAMRINGERKAVEVDSRMTLLDTLRERLGMTGSKKAVITGNAVPAR